MLFTHERTRIPQNLLRDFVFQILDSSEIHRVWQCL
jgi:hypothetical protein